MHHHFLKISLIIWLLTFCSFVIADETASAPQQTAVITLTNRLPSDILPAITPFLEKGATAKAFENQIIVQASASNIAAIKDIVKNLDIPSKQLMISVSNGYDQPKDVSAQMQTITTTREADTNIDHIRVNNGQVAYIKTSVTIPLITSQMGGVDLYHAEGSFAGAGPAGVIGGQGHANEIAAAYGQTVDYQDLNSGLLVRPQLIGEKVRLDLMSQNQQAYDNYQNPGSAAYSGLKTETSLTVPLNKWVYFGGNRQQEDTTMQTLTTQPKDQNQKALWLKVDVIND
ncbi:MAG: secretin N-terminal domain-containing protein [Candidatus Berkiella sp.]